MKSKSTCYSINEEAKRSRTKAKYRLGEVNLEEEVNTRKCEPLQTNNKKQLDKDPTMVKNSQWPIRKRMKQGKKPQNQRGPSNSNQYSVDDLIEL